jgi:protein phosphatase
MSVSNQTDTAEWAHPASAETRDQPPPFSSQVRVDLAGQTHRGKVRPNNEDHYLMVRFGRYLEPLGTNLPEGEIPKRSEETGYAMVVADGIGGSAAGEHASRLAISTLVNLALNTPDWILRLDEDSFYQEALRRAEERVRQINATLAAQAQVQPALRGFGTTLTAAWSLGIDLVVSHVGDSRAYLLRRGQLHKLTADHTLAQALADIGQIAPQEIATHRMRHVLTRSLGMEDQAVHPDVHRFLLEDRDCLLLCTDGLTEMVEDARIAEILGSGETAAQRCQQLVDEALQEGGKDNVTVIVARYQLP